MNWNLILQLSLFGPAMGLATVFFIPSNIEPAFWFVIFLICAYLIARQAPGNRFLHGVSLGVANSVWITASHILFFSRYIATHAQEAEMMKSMPLSLSPRLIMALTGPIVGVISGLIIGLFALIAGAFVKPTRPQTQAPTT
jgi:hypothetical protein